MTTDDGAPKPGKPRRARSRATEGAADEVAANRQLVTPASESSIPEGVGDGAPIQADRVQVRMAAVGRLETGGDIQVIQGAIGGARATEVTIQQGALGGALAGRVSLRQSVARSLLAREAVVQQSFVRTIIAAQVRVEKATGVGILIARQVTGDVRVLVDWRAAAAFGAAFGLVTGLLRLGGRPRKGR
jgi:hypothetical protein